MLHCRQFSLVEHKNIKEITMPSINLAATQEEYDRDMPGFLRERPIPPDENGDPSMSEGAWLKKEFAEWFAGESFMGKKKIAADAVQKKTIFT